MRCACIDIGSNTTRLLVAEHASGRLRAVHEERVFTRIGRELIESDTISPAKRAEVTGVVGDQLAAAHAHGAHRIRAVATAAIRRAANGAELVGEIRERTGVQVAVLSDREEARLAFVGAAGMIEQPPAGPLGGSSPSVGPLGVIDVGGGSTEVVIGEPPDRIEWWASLPIGSGTLAVRRLGSDPPTAAQLGAARAEVAAVVAGIGWAGPPPVRTLAVGGSATSLCRLAGEVLHPAALADALAALAGQPAEVVARRFDIAPERARLLPAGLLILEALAQRLGGHVSVGRGGIREGVLIEAGRG